MLPYKRSPFGGLDWERENSLCALASSRLCVVGLALLLIGSGLDV